MDDKIFHHPGQILREDRLGLFTQFPFLSVHFHWTTTEGDGLGARQEVGHLGKRREGVELHDGFHPPIMPESQPGFRLIAYWKHAPRSDSFHIGRD
jgi:hypothetical protein